ncbi:MAG: NADH-quinone oxidoreductase subunit C [Gracilibacteraceae bacterium]|jgi:ech hydrogenase subunit D|nr:NADH-quinone oxidoreductase subunit C [Gracilibacteraceae bacterium]
MDPQVFFPAVKTEVVEIAQRNKALGYRFAQMHCVKTPSEMFIIYTFEKQDLSIEQYRIPAETDGAVPSVSGVFLAAVLYENEISELYGVEFTGMAIDFGGTLYETAKPRAFAEVAAPVKKTPVKQAAVAE